MKKILFFYIILAILIRLPGLDLPFFSDEMILDLVVHDLSFNYNHPPLGPSILRLITMIFGKSIIVMRLYPLIFNILTMFIIYLICKKNYNKKVFFFSLFLMTFLFYPILSSLQLESDSLLIFLFSLGFFFFFFYSKKYWTGFIGGLILLTRYSGILFFIILFLYSLISEKEKGGEKKKIKDMIIIFVISIIIFSLFPLIYFLIGNFEGFTITISHLFESTSGETISILDKLIILVLWATPLLLGLILLSLSKIEKKDLLFWIWIIVGLGFNLLFMPRGDFSRYFMIILPPLIILSSKYLSTIRLNKKHICLGLISFIIFYIIFFLLNLNSRIMFPHMISNYFDAIKHLNFEFMFPYSISQGSWFGISFLAILIMLIFSLIFFILIFFKKYRKLFLILFISLGLSYNIFLSGEYLLHLSQPNINKIIYEMVDYTKENNLKYPIYSINKGILDQLYDYKLYPDRIKIVGYRIDRKTIDKFSDRLSKEDGTIVFLGFTAEFKKEDIDSIKNCNLIKTFSDKNINIGYIYLCKKK